MFIEAKDDGSGGDNWTTGTISRAKLKPTSSFFTCRLYVIHVCKYQYQLRQLLVFYRPDALPVAQPTVSKH